MKKQQVTIGTVFQKLILCCTAHLSYHQTLSANQRNRFISFTASAEIIQSVSNFATNKRRRGRICPKISTIELKRCRFVKIAFPIRYDGTAKDFFVPSYLLFDRKRTMKSGLQRIWHFSKACFCLFVAQNLHNRVPSLCAWSYFLMKRD